MSRNNPQTLRVPSYGYYNPKQWTLIDAVTCSGCRGEGCQACGWSGEIWLLAEKNRPNRNLRLTSWTSQSQVKLSKKFSKQGFSK